MGVFTIPLLNGIRFTPEEIDIDPSYNTLPFDNQIDQQSYAQPWQQTDIDVPIVLLSDYPNLTLDFYKSTPQKQHIISVPFTPTASSLIGVTFLQYLAIVNFSAFPTGWCFGKITYDANLPASISASLSEFISPFIDGNLQIKDNGADVLDIYSSGPGNVKIEPGHTYSFNAYGTETSTAANPRIRLTVTKNGNVIFDQSAVQTDTVSIVYTGIAQPGAVYTVAVITEDTAAVVNPINIADNAAVTPDWVSWISCPLDIQVNHPETMKIEYQHSENTKDVLFFPGNIILQHRVESNMVGGYQPKSDRQSFDDQNYNATLLNGIPFRTFTYWILGTGGPDWVVDKLNIIFTCDQVRIDGTFYVATNGTDFKAERPTKQKNQDGMWSLDLQSVPGFQFGQLTAGSQSAGGLIVVRQVWPPAPFPNFAGSFKITGIFTINSTLDYLEIINYGLQTFTLLLGASLGSNDIASLEIGTPNADASIDLISTHDIGYGFNTPTTVYCTIPNGVNIKALFVYDQLDSPPITAPAGSSGTVPQGAVGYYKELAAGYFTRDWDISTGLGQVGSQWEGYQILDQAAGKVLLGWDRTTIGPSQGRGTPGVTGAIETGGGTATIQVTANAVIGATTIAVNALGNALPNGTKLVFTSGAGQGVVIVNANAAIGDVSITIIPLTTSITTGAVYTAINLASGNEIIIPREALPAEGLFMFTDEQNSTDSDFPPPNDETATVAFQNTESITRKNYSILKGTIPPNRGVTENMGAGSSINIGNDGLIMLCWVKL